MTAAHTPGPWEQDGRPIEGLRRKDGRKVTVCMMVDLSTEWGDIIDLVTPEDKANARLIAAAPDMLAALTLILPLAKGYVMANDVGSNRQFIAAAEAAIAKAEGMQS